MRLVPLYQRQYEKFWNFLSNAINAKISTLLIVTTVRINVRHLSLCLLISLTLTACGVKGPLYIPEQKYPQDTVPQNAPQRNTVPQDTLPENTAPQNTPSQK
jgi:predicted small lipoprotein YifL